MNVRGPTLAVIRGITDMNGALAWRALITRYAPNTAPQVQSLMSAILNVKTFLSELTTFEIALDEWQENHKWESICGDRFNVSMKKAIFLDRAPSTMRIPFQMQSLDTFESMTAVTLQFLQHNAQYQASVTVSPNNKKGPDEMEIDALTKKGKSHEGKGKSKADREKLSCYVCGRIGHMANDCWFKDMNKVNTTKDCWSKDTSKVNTTKGCWFKEHEQEWTTQQQRQEREKQRQKERKEQCQRDYEPDRVDRNTCKRNDYLYKSDLANYPK